MPTVTIDVNYDGYVIFDGISYSKNDGEPELLLGYDVIAKEKFRTYLRFPLTLLPKDASVTQVRLKVYCRYGGGIGHLTDIHAYGTSGQEDPQTDPPETCFTRCASGTLYVDDSTDLRTTGEKWFTLPSQANIDVMNAKAAVDRFSIGLHEEGDDDLYAIIDAIEAGGGGIKAQLEITYTPIIPLVKKATMKIDPGPHLRSRLLFAPTLILKGVGVPPPVVTWEDFMEEWF